MNFTDHIYIFLDKIKNKENFSLSRFSDGEMFMLQGKNIQLHKDLNYVEGKYKT